MSATAVRIARVPAAQLRPLRSEVLRPGTPPEALVYDGDDARDTLHVAAIDADERIVGIASLCREAARDEPLPVDAWRLRGMATSAAVRGSGLGAQLLTACFAHVRAHGGGLLWCNAREVALGFYEKLGLETVGDRFDIAGIGPHFVMRRLLPRLRIESGARRVVAVLAMQSIEHVVGHCSVEPRADGAWQLDALSVEPRWSRRGVGSELLAAACELARQHGATALLIDAEPGATGFFEKRGGERIGTARPEIDPARVLQRFRLAV